FPGRRPARRARSARPPGGRRAMSVAHPVTGSPLAAGYGLIGGSLGFIAVAAGAFGAHALRSTLAPAMLQAFETAARYQLVHALAIVVVALAIERIESRGLKMAGVLFVVGIVLFSGSLYALALTGQTFWGIVTP